MTMKLEQAAMALLAHWDTPAWKYLKPTGDLMADLREALAEQAEQEPVAWRWPTHNGYAYAETHFDGEGGEPLYTRPARTKDLTDEEIREALYWVEVEAEELVFARAVMAKYKEKNK